MVIFKYIKYIKIINDRLWRGIKPHETNVLVLFLDNKSIFGQFLSHSQVLQDDDNSKFFLMSPSDW